MHFEAINWLAVIVATISAFALGALWYSPMLFGKAWMAANGFSEEGLAEGFNPAKVYGISFVFTLVMALNLAGFLAGHDPDALRGIAMGFHAGFGWIVMGLGVIAMFERRSLGYILINGGYMTAAMLLMGAILGAWH
jgi:hypothetical protein